MGNSKGRAVYEGNLPENFRRPQTDLALETFIQDKYEKKKYIALEWKGLEPIGKIDWDKEIEEEMRNAKKSKTIVNNGQSKFRITVPVNESSKSVSSKIDKPKSRIEDPPKVMAPGLATNVVNTAVTSASSASSNFSADLLGLEIQSTTNHSTPQSNSANTTGSCNTTIDDLSDLNALSDISLQQSQNQQKMSTANILKLYGSLPPPTASVPNNFQLQPQQQVPTSQSTNPFHQLGGSAGLGGLGGLFNNPPMPVQQQPPSFLNGPQQSLMTSGLAGLQLGPSNHQQNNFFQ